MTLGLVHRHPGRVDGLDRAHAVAFDAWDLHQTADRVARHPEIVLHPDLGRVLYLLVCATQRGNQAPRGHRACHAHLALTPYLRA